MVELIVLLVFPAAMILSAAMDLFTMTISNRIALALVGGFFALSVVVGLPLEDVVRHVGAGFSMLVLVFLMFWAGWIGGGDAKLFAATALWLGWEHLFNYAVLLSIFGGILTILLLVARSRPLPRMLREEDWAIRLHKPRGDIPYGIALALAGLVVYPQTFWMSALGV